MKKFAWMIAALSVCAASFTACSDDSKDDAKKANGDTCSVAEECDSNYCNDAKKCADAPKAKGDVCTASSECAEGLYCAKDGDAKKCAEKLADAASCDSAEACKSGKCEGADGAKVCGVAADNRKDDGASCTDAAECKSGKCEGADGAKVCGAAADNRKDDGASCTDAAECKSGKCEGADGAKVCGGAASETKKEIGASCTDAAECSSNRCEGADGAKVCVSEKYKVLDKGAECVNSIDCKDGLYCALDSADNKKKCDDLKAANSSCQIDDECETKHCAASDGSTEKKCVARVALKDVGQACTSNDECRTDNCDVNGTQVCLGFADGKFCESDSDCASNLCNYSIFSPVCVAADTKSQLDEACNHIPCGDGLVCSTHKICKIDNKKACTAHADCNTGYCDKTLHICDSMPDENFCDPSRYTITCDHSGATSIAWTCNEETETLESKECSNGCKQGEGCVNENRVACTEKADCASLGEAYDCIGLFCVDLSSPDALCGGSCSEGECIKGICVTDEMKSLAAGAAWPTNINAESFCYGDKLYSLNGQGRVSIYECNALGYGACVVYDTIVRDSGSSYMAREADCNSKASVVEACAAAKTTSDYWSLSSQKCISDTDLFKVKCQVDTENNVIALPDYDDVNSKDCADSDQVCSEAGGAAACVNP